MNLEGRKERRSKGRRKEGKKGRKYLLIPQNCFSEVTVVHISTPYYIKLSNPHPVHVEFIVW